MKFRIAIIAAVSAVICSCAPVPITVSADPPPEVLYVGDSVTTGIEHLHPDKPTGKPWYGFVDDHLGSTGDVHAGDGWRASDALTGFPAGPHGLVIVALGTNDQMTGVPLDVYLTNLRTLVQTGEQCIVITPWRRAGWSVTYSVITPDNHSQYVAKGLQVATDESCGFIDWTNIPSDIGGVSYDGLHPTPYGQGVLGAEVVKNISLV